MPEYWEFTKAMRLGMLDYDAQVVYRRIWGNRCNKELKVE
jgi:hypothetical protein